MTVDIGSGLRAIFLGTTVLAAGCTSATHDLARDANPNTVYNTSIDKARNNPVRVTGGTMNALSPVCFNERGTAVYVIRDPSLGPQRYGDNLNAELQTTPNNFICSAEPMIIPDHIVRKHLKDNRNGVSGGGWGLAGVSALFGGAFGLPGALMAGGAALTANFLYEQLLNSGADHKLKETFVLHQAYERHIFERRNGLPPSSTYFQELSGSSRPALPTTRPSRGRICTDPNRDWWEKPLHCQYRSSLESGTLQLTNVEDVTFTAGKGIPEHSGKAQKPALALS